MESKVHFGSYGYGQTNARRAAERRANAGKAWHSSLKLEEITDLFIIWGIVGRRRVRRPAVRLASRFDRGIADEKGQ